MERQIVTPLPQLLFWSRSKLTEHERDDSKRGKGLFKKFHFHSYTRGCFNVYREMFYSQGRKIVPENIGQLVSENSLAFWFLDDGSLDKRFTYRLHTNSFRGREVDWLRRALLDNFSLESALHKTISPESDRGFFIYVGAKSGKKLHDIVKLLVGKGLPFFYYKLSKPRND